MRLRYFLGMVATLSLTACSVDVDVYPTSKLTVKTPTKTPTNDSVKFEKVILVDSKVINGDTVWNVINVTPGKTIELINGTYELLYVVSSYDNFFTITGYNYGDLDYSKARVVYNGNQQTMTSLGHIFYDRKTVTVPGAGSVSVSPHALTQEYTIQWTVTAEREAAFKEKPTGGVMGNLPSSFSLKTGKPAESGSLKVNFSFTPETLSSGSVKRTAKVILPIMDKLPEKFYLRTSNSSKDCDFTIDNDTITIK